MLVRGGIVLLLVKKMQLLLLHVRIIKDSLVLSCACKWKKKLKMNKREKIVRKRVVNYLGGDFTKSILRVVILRSLLFAVVKIQISRSGILRVI